MQLCLQIPFIACFTPISTIEIFYTLYLYIRQYSVCKEYHGHSYDYYLLLVIEGLMSTVNI